MDSPWPRGLTAYRAGLWAALICALPLTLGASRAASAQEGEAGVGAAAEGAPADADAAADDAAGQAAVAPEAAAPEPLSPESVVWLAMQESTTDHEAYYAELLTRELVRQAVLIAARDGLGLTTRDAVLRDPLPEAGSDNAGRVLQLAVHGRKDKSILITLSRDGGKEVLWTKELPLTEDAFEIYLLLARAMEEASRGEAVEALTKVGYAGAAAPGGAAEPDGKTVQSLRECTAPSQFQAVRELHAQIRRDGESPALVSALARGYAHLGYLTQHYWNTQCKAFQARSLLYAERLVAREPQRALGLWVRAYARAWAGLHGAALADLAAAETLAESTGESAPSWTSLVERHCRYDFAGLRELAGEAEYPWAELAALLAFMDMAQGGGDAGTIEAGQPALAAVPYAWVIYDRLIDFAGVGYGHQATVQGSLVLNESLPAAVAALRGLPAEIKDRLPPARSGGGLFGFLGGGRSAEPFGSAPRRVAEALTAPEAEIADRGEPAWGVLGRLYQEEDFVQTAQRAMFLKVKLGVPIDDFVVDVLPNLAGYPYAPWLESCAIDSRADPARHREALLRVERGDLYWRMYWFLSEARSTSLANHETGDELGRRLSERMDAAAVEMETALHWYREHKDWILAFSEKYLTITPYSPQFIAALAEHSAADDAQLAAWEADFGQHERVLAALGRRYAANKRYDDAERCLKRRIELSPDHASFEQLANVYWAQGDKDRWQVTLEDSLLHADYGLGHASVRVKLAHYFMEQGDFARARPYAEDAAQTWAGWAMDCASECLEALHEWEASEEWVRNAALRYPDGRLRWYFWCRRTGRGDVKSARAAAESLAAEATAKTPPSQQDLVGVYHVLAGDLRAAYDAFQLEYEQNGSYWSGFHVILLADELDDAATRERILGHFVRSGVPAPRVSTYGLAKFAVLLQDAYQAEHELDTESLDKLLASLHENSRMDIAYFAGKFLALHGDVEASERYYKISYKSFQVSQYNRTLAAAALLAAGYDAEELEGPNTGTESR